MNAMGNTLAFFVRPQLCFIREFIEHRLKGKINDLTVSHERVHSGTGEYQVNKGAAMTEAV